MNSPVTAQVRVLSESLVAQIAGVRSLARVRPQMCLQHITIEEPFAADSAAEWPILFDVVTPVVSHVLV